MKKHILTLILILFTFVGFGQISITIVNTNYIENFNTLVNTGTSNTLPNGWYLLESGSNANALYSAGTGSSNTGNTYSFGLEFNTNRTLGSLQSNNLVPKYGCEIKNNTGQIIESISVTYTGKTWRVGATSRTDRIDFSYSLNATSLTTGIWVDFNSLDYQNTGQSTAPISGSVLHSQSISSVITGLTLNSGSSIWFRFSDLDIPGDEDGMGIDDFSINLSPLSNLPIELISFEGSKKEEYNVLKWQTASEHNNSHYILERSSTGDYTEKDVINVVNGAGNSTQLLDYDFVDTDAPETINYYRLTQVDYDGNFKQFGPISIDNRVTRNIPKYFNIMGQEVNEYETGLIILRYEDGTVEKVIR